MSIEKTVRVKLLETNNAILMCWEHLIHREDVPAAFDAITAMLDEAPVPMYVVVDISSNPRFPLSDTVNGAIGGPARHPKLEGWLVVGKNNFAQLIGRSISAITGTRNIHWFESMDDALAFARHPLLH